MSEFLFGLAGIMIGWLAGQYSLFISENVNIINDHLGDMEEFAEAIQEYWLQNPATYDDELAFAARIRAKHSAVAVFYGAAPSRMTRTRLREYQMLQVRLFKAATGGNFETKGRAMDPEVAIRSYQLCSEIVHLLRAARRDEISLKRSCSQIWQHVAQQD